MQITDIGYILLLGRGSKPWLNIRIPWAVLKNPRGSNHTPQKETSLEKSNGSKKKELLIMTF